jgi:multidrug efflux pump subunit AcrA (membrane-fusion protein)
VVFLSQRPGEGDNRPVLAVNPKTVVEREGRKVVLRIDGDVLQAVPVTPGRMLGDALEIGAGALKPGDRLVLGPDERLAGGSHVAVAGK